ncbi:MAG: hypothetical protein WCK98_00300 [bacterium]
MFSTKIKKIFISLVLILSLALTGLQSIKAQAATTSVAIGETRTYTITYNNAQGEPGSNPMLLKIYIGDKLDVNINSFVDTFDPTGATPAAFCINPAFIGVNTEPGWGYYLTYAPRSSTTAVPANNTCTTGGLSTANPTDIPVGKVGTITFKATLKNTANAGDILDPATAVSGKYQGLRAKILTTVGTTVFTSPDADLIINVTAAPATVVDPDLTTGPGSLGTSTNCVAGTNVTIGQTYSCSWPITGTGTFTLPTGGIQARTNQAANNSAPVSTCTITGAVLTCTGISTTGTPSALTPGSANVQLGKGTTPATWPTKSTVNLVAAATVVDPDLTTGPGSIGTSTDCVAGTNVTIGQPYTCSWPITGTAPFTLPTGGIQARTNQAANNSAPVSTCTITGAVLTCTGISTTGTPGALTPGSANVQLGKGATPATWPTKATVNLVAASTEIDPNTGGNVGNFTSCTPAASNIIIGTTYSCTFPLTGTGPFTLPTGGIQAKTNQGSVNSTTVSCAVSGSTLVCSGIKTDATFTIGSANVQLGQGATPSTWNNKGSITLGVATIVVPRTGGFEIAAIGLALAGIIGGGAYFVIRRKKVKSL